MNNAELLQVLEKMKNLLIAVSTDGPRIDSVDGRYQDLFAAVSEGLVERNIVNPIPFPGLWDWYGRWSSGDLPSYQSRRKFIGQLFDPLCNQIRTGHKVDMEPTGWQRVDRTIGEIRERLASAIDEEHYQAVGLLCREALISLAQAVYDRNRHPPIDNVQPSDTDAKRMLQAYIASEFPGAANEETRKHARSALDLANVLQHRRTADFRLAAMCVEATSSVTSVIAIMAGVRDPGV